MAHFFFTSFVFEHDVVATDRRLDELYLSALSKCDLYIALIGRDYGYADNEGVSATAREYEEATRLGIPRLVFVKNMPDSDRDTRELAFLKRISHELFRPTFSNSAELCDAVTSALAQLLEDRQASFSGQSFEEEEVADFSELDDARIRWFVRTARGKRAFQLPEDAPIEDVLAALKMIGPSGRIRRVATWCFGKDPQKYAPTSGVKCLSWYGTDRIKPMASYKWLQGDVFALADGALEFIKEKLDLRIGGSNGGAQSRALYLVKFIEDAGSGTTGMFRICQKT